MIKASKRKRKKEGDTEREGETDRQTYIEGEGGDAYVRHGSKFNRPKAD